MEATALTVRNLQDWKTVLVATFTDIQHTRMQGVPVINENLQVNADHFVEWNQYYLGVMVTPWFMNLLLLPATDEKLAEMNALKVGKKQSHVFPSGDYEFIVGSEEGIGTYLSCSLFSPMFDFADQEAVTDTASAVIKELMKIENYEVIDPDPNDEDSHKSTYVKQIEAEKKKEEEATPVEERSLSRRQFFGGAR